jgi:cytochrome P450
MQQRSGSEGTTAGRRRRAPRGTLIWGHREAIVKDPIRFLSMCVREYGDAVPLRIGPFRFWLISDPRLIGDILTAKASSFVKDIGLRRASIFLGEGLLTTEGKEHERRSRIAMPAFQRKEVERYADAIVDVARAVARSWRDGETVDVATEMSRAALAIVSRALFGSEVRGDAARIGAALTELLELMEERFYQALPLPLAIPTPHNRRFTRARDVLDEVVYRMIRERRDSGVEREDLLGRLLAARHEDGTGLEEREVRDEVMTLFLAGHETTANALAFAIRLLAENPEAARRLRAEADEVLGERPARAADVPHLAYAQAVFEETLRLYPPAWILGREAREDVVLGGTLEVKRWSMVAMSQYLVHRDPRWFEDPLAFRPERFAREAARPAPWTYFPFGGGKRACIGRSFALLEGVLVLATLAQEVELEVDLARPLELLPQMTLRPRGGVAAVVRRRVRVGSR